MIWFSWEKVEPYFACWFPREKDHCHTSLDCCESRSGEDLLDSDSSHFRISAFGSSASYFILHLIYWRTRSVNIHEAGLDVFYHFISIDRQILERQRWKGAKPSVPSKGPGGSYPNTADLGSFSNNKHLKHIFGRQMHRFEPTKVQSHSKHHSKKCGVSFKHRVIFTCSSPPMPSSSHTFFCNFSSFAFH